jgi:hypothetical protein
MTECTVDVVWGAKAISRVINRTEMQTYHMLEKGLIPGARKVGKLWAFSPSVFAAAMREAAA